MSKRTTFTNISPLPPGISREQVFEFLHNHQEMIDLNPLVIERHRISPPPHAPEEEKGCVWWSMTDKIEYLPGGVAKGDVSYTCAFYDLPDGLQTHCYAPMGTDIRDRWSLGGTLPGEPPQPTELGLGAPTHGLYLREDIELRCNFLMSSFVKKTLQKAHGKLVDTLGQKATLSSRSSTTVGTLPGTIASRHSDGSRPYTPPVLQHPEQKQNGWPSPATGHSIPAPSYYNSPVVNSPNSPYYGSHQMYTPPPMQPQGLAPTLAPHQIHQRLTPPPVSMSPCSAGAPMPPRASSAEGYANGNCSGAPANSAYPPPGYPWPAPLNVQSSQGPPQHPSGQFAPGYYNNNPNGYGQQQSQHPPAAELGGGYPSAQDQPLPQEMATHYNNGWPADEKQGRPNGSHPQAAELE